MYSDNEGNVTCKAVSFIQHSLLELVRNAQPAASAGATKQFFASLSREHNVLGIGQLEEAKSTCLVLLPSIGLPAFADISSVFNIAVRVRCCRGFHEATAQSLSRWRHHGFAMTGIGASAARPSDPRTQPFVTRSVPMRKIYSDLELVVLIIISHYCYGGSGGNYKLSAFILPSRTTG